MAKAWQLNKGYGNQDLVIDNLYQLAASEIYQDYGDKVKINRKTLRKYGRNQNVQTTEVDISFISGTETYPTTNAITHFSSSNVNDTGTMYLEGMTIDNGQLSFVTQTFTLAGQTKTALTTPMARATRGRGVADGVVYVYEDDTVVGGVPQTQAKKHLAIAPADHTSLKAGTSIAKGNYFILLDLWASMGRAATAACDIRMKVANLDSEIFANKFYTQEWFTVSLDAPFSPPVNPYLIVPPNSDIVMTAVASGGTQDIKAGFMGVFADIVQ